METIELLTKRIQDTRPLLYLVNFSGGLSSYASLKRTIEQKGKENTIAVFADTKGDNTIDSHAALLPNCDGEDDDVYRFIDDAEKYLDIPIIRLKPLDGLGVWGNIFKKRCITMRSAGGSYAPCTQVLKQKRIDDYCKTLSDYNIVHVFGLNYDEQKRVLGIRIKRGNNCWFPMTETPYASNHSITRELIKVGIKPPIMYSQNYPHANCGGACVKAGQYNWANCLTHNPERFYYNLRQEALFRNYVKKDVSIMTKQENGIKRTYTLSELYLDILNKKEYDKEDYGKCSCFIE